MQQTHTIQQHTCCSTVRMSLMDAVLSCCLCVDESSSNAITLMRCVCVCVVYVCVVDQI